MWRYADLIDENAEHLGYLEAILVGKGVMFGAGWEPSTASELFRCNNSIPHALRYLLTISTLLQILQGL